MRSLFTFFMCVLPCVAIHAQSNQQEIPLTPEFWQADSERARFITHRGVPAIEVTPSPDGLFIGPGQVVLKDMQFEEGTIEFDVEITDFFLSAIYFRRHTAENAEIFYLRTYRAGDPTGPDAIQYTPLTKGVALWDVYSDYQAPAVIHKEGWNRVKLVISGKRMQVYVNDMDRPALTVPELMGESPLGSIAFEGGGIFANLVVKPGITEGLSSEAAYDPVRDDVHYIHDWSVSAPVALPPGRELVSAMGASAYSDHFPTDTTTWYAVETERGGLVNLSRSFGKSDERRVVWLKKIIHSDTNQTIQVHLGFSDELWVLIDRSLVYVDKNLYANPIMKDPYGQISIDDASFDLPLLEGENELLVGVANSFFGWAILARLSNVDGITFR